jgi:hypothetical protein
MLDYFVLTPAEASGLYQGLVLQALLRQWVLNHVPAAIVFVNLWILFYRYRRSAHPYFPLVAYFIVSLLLIVGFWPDITPFGTRAARLVSASGIASYAAMQDPEAAVRTAEDTQALPPEIDTSVLEPPLYGLMLRHAVDVPLRLGRFFNAQAHRPFAGLMPMQWLLGQEFPAELTQALNDWVEGCYKPSLLTDQEFQDAITSEQLLPWGNTPVATALASRQVAPFGQTGRGGLRTTNLLGLEFLANPGSTTTVPCTTYLAALELAVQRLLYRITTPNGTPLTEVFAQAYGMSPTQQGRFLLHQRMLRTMAAPVPAPSLAATYGGLSAASTVTGALAGALRGGKAGAVSGAGGAVLSQAEQQVQRLLSWVGWAMWLAYWLPDTMGMILLLVVGLFPVVLCFGLWPGQQVRVLLTYFLVLVWACSSPLWFAVIDLDARAAAARAVQFEDPLLQLFNWAPQQLSWVVHTVIGLSLFPPLMLALLYLGLRGLGSVFTAATPRAA